MLLFEETYTALKVHIFLKYEGIIQFPGNRNHDSGIANSLLFE